MKLRTVFMIFYFCICQFISIANTDIMFSTPSELSALTSPYIRNLFIDSSGNLWIGTNNDLSMFDGRKTISMRAAFGENTFPSNEILAISEDSLSNIWVGTRNGLAIINRSNWETYIIENDLVYNMAIQRLVFSKDGYMWIGTQHGLVKYDVADKSYSKVSCKNSSGEEIGSVTALMEDNKGYLWIGGWSDGLIRYNVKKNVFESFPDLEQFNNVSYVSIDSKNRIWLGIWGEGLLVFDYPSSGSFDYQHFIHTSINPQGLPDNYIYSIFCNPQNDEIWLGTGAGLSVITESQGNFSFSNFLPSVTQGPISDQFHSNIGYNEITDIVCDKFGSIWLATFGGGVEMVTVNQSQIKPHYAYPFHYNPNEGVCSIKDLLIDNKGNTWIGIGTKGVVITDSLGNQSVDPDLSFLSHKLMPVASITETQRTGRIWIGTFGAGVWIFDYKGQNSILKVGDSNTTQSKRLTYWKPSENLWLGYIIYDVLEDSRDLTWFASQVGVSVMDAKGNKISLISKTPKDHPCNYCTTQLAEDSNGNIWVATENAGILKIRVNSDSLENSQIIPYSIDNNKILTNTVATIFIDSKNRIWGGSEVMGLFLYDKDKDSFIHMHHKFGLTGEGVTSIEEDKNGLFWITTNSGLLSLYVSDDLSSTSFHRFTSSDGLQANIFNRNASSLTPDGRLMFGGNYGYNIFYPEELNAKDSSCQLKITDVKINDKSWYYMESDLRNSISQLSPEFLSDITLDHNHNSIVIEFSSDNYSQSRNITYAYRLQGIDKDWIYTDDSNPVAVYRNLPAGKRSLYIAVSDGKGDFLGNPKIVNIKILPPPWLTWWAFVIYFIAAVIILSYIIKAAKHRVELKNEIKLKERERARLEELNSARMHFFTTITHELLTPLSIISAAIDNRKEKGLSDSYSRIIVDNANKLIRLVQQILEFRKAETGNLKLKVLKGNLDVFIQNCVSLIQPYAERRNISITYTGTSSLSDIWFDPDKIDKILYNLISNAIKYNKPNGSIVVSLKKKGDSALISVSDTGNGMDKEQLDKLFTFFHDGEYRRFKTTGTGIRLALTKSLVNLHHGNISVESTVGEGTQFTIQLPIGVDKYHPAETDTSIPLVVKREINSVSEKENDEIIKESPSNESEKPKILLVDDEEDLRFLVKELLVKDYEVITASSAEEALELLHQNPEIQLIISDVMMGGMDGMQMCHQLKSNFDTSDIPILLLTAKTSAADRVDAYDCGADAYIAKPFDLAVLKARVKNLLKAREKNHKEFKQQFTFQTSNFDYKTDDEDFLERAFKLVQNHLSDADYGQEQFIDDLGVSRSTVFRKLKSLTGMTFVDFVKNVRLKEARRLMKSKDNIRISEIAYAVGFNNPKYFSSCFKKEFGVTPSEFLESEAPQNI